MRIKEKIQPNKVNAPVIFIGFGGIGSKIIGGISSRCSAHNDDTSNIRFVVMDTDVNDLLNVNKSSHIKAIQTSSTSTVGNYLRFDTDAKRDWFPNNKMIEPKTVSEGAGQIRAISRLALNATITKGVIQDLYSAIDDLFLKDGSGYKQSIRVVIASTAAGGTGSGMAMEVGMMVRHYIEKNYPGAGVMIRGFFVMPSVMDTVIKTQSERESTRCNGYATIKEINAFMMKASGFFDTVDELKRYQDLHMVVPNTTGGSEKLSNLPFDFCFLMDRTDADAGNMLNLSQYIDYAAQSLYEQNIGPMRAKASSMEDNVLKLCIDPDKMGRCRFGSVGASTLRYPYEEIKKYIAINWAESSVIGVSSNENLSDKDRAALLERAWLQIDAKYKEERSLWENNPNRSSKGEPIMEDVYISAMEGGKEDSSGNDFVASLWSRYLNPKIDALPDDVQARNASALASKYVDNIIDEVVFTRIQSKHPDVKDTLHLAQNPVAGEAGYMVRFNNIKKLVALCETGIFESDARNLAKEIASSRASISKSGLGEYMLEKYLSVNGNAVHPNAARFLLYTLKKYIESDYINVTRNADHGAFTKDTKEILFGPVKDGVADTSVFKVGLVKNEKMLEDMCGSCDEGGSASEKEKCNGFLTNYFSVFRAYYTSLIKLKIYEVLLPAVNRLINEYERFYNTFEEKVPGLELKKEDIVTKISFHNGDCVKNLLGDKKYLDKLSELVGQPGETSEAAATLYAKIFEGVRGNAYIEERNVSNPFDYEAKTDIFDDVIIEYYENLVDETNTQVKPAGILQAIKLEYNVKCAVELDDMSEESRQKKAPLIRNEDSMHKYVKSVIDCCNNLASPGINKDGYDEPREVHAIACSEETMDGDGIRVSDFIPEAIRTNTVSRYELHFFRSIYNIMPTQLAKMSAPVYETDVDEYLIGCGELAPINSAGDYFNSYQNYMDKITSSSKKSSIITPHVDTRWNSVSVLPEIDLDYQKYLMRRIHKAFIYGFVYDRIHLTVATNCCSGEQSQYKYYSAKNDLVDLLVSNNTKCNVLYEVLDALYNDRLAVSVINDYAEKRRSECVVAGSKGQEEIAFFNKLDALRFKHVIDDVDAAKDNEKLSLFTLILLYCNTLPTKDKDMTEMKTMVQAVIEILYGEIRLCTSNIDDLPINVSKVLIEQFNQFVENFNAHRDLLDIGRFSEEILRAVRKYIESYMVDRELDVCVDKLAVIE